MLCCIAMVLICSCVVALVTAPSWIVQVVDARKPGDEKFIAAAYAHAEPKLVRGQAFLLTPGDEDFVIKNMSGREVASRLVAFKIVRYVRSETPFRHIFRLEGFNRPVAIESKKSLMDIASLDPIVEDQPLAKLISSFPRGLAWVYGGGITGEGWLPDDRDVLETDFTPMKIKHALRLWRPETLMISVGGSGMGGNLDNFLYTAEHPIRIIVKPSHLRGEFHGEWFVGSITDEQMSREIVRRMDPRTYAIFSVHAADLWDVPRKIAPYPPSRDFLGANAAIRKGLKSRELVPGMSYREVAWVMGWPNVRGTPDAIVAMHLDSWEFPSSVFSDYAHFRDGKFTSYEQFNLP